MTISSKLKNTISLQSKDFGSIYYMDDFPGGFGSGMTLYWKYDSDSDTIVYGYDYLGCYHGDFKIQDLHTHANPVT